MGDQWGSVLYSPTGRPLSSDSLFLNLTESGLGFGHQGWSWWWDVQILIWNEWQRAWAR